MTIGDAHRIEDADALEALYGAASEGSLKKEVSFIHELYKPFIENAPFVAMATSGEGGLDVSPRGDPAGFVVIHDERTLLLPDRRGNNRLDSLRNILTDPRVSLLFLVPGVGETLRVNGRAFLTTDPDLLERFTLAGKPPRSVVVIEVETVYFQCSKALVRSRLWEPSSRVERRSLPSAGRLLAEIGRYGLDGEAYDRAWPQRLEETIY